jgi:hypothetical protein
MSQVLEIAGTCPGLAIKAEGLVWVDSLGRSHLLAKAARISVRDVALRIKRSEDTVWRRIAAGEIYPVIRKSARDVEVFEVAVDDYLVRDLVRVKGAGRG